MQGDRVARILVRDSQRSISLGWTVNRVTATYVTIAHERGECYALFHPETGCEINPPIPSVYAEIIRLED